MAISQRYTYSPRAWNIYAYKKRCSLSWSGQKEVSKRFAVDFVTPAQGEIAGSIEDVHTVLLIL